MGQRYPGGEEKEWATETTKLKVECRNQSFAWKVGRIKEKSWQY